MAVFIPLKQVSRFFPPLTEAQLRKYNRWWSCIRVSGAIKDNNGNIFISWYVAKWHPYCLRYIMNIIKHKAVETKGVTYVKRSNWFE